MKRTVSFLIFFTSFVCPELVSAQSVMINEWMSKNSTILEDEDGDFPDWIELYNASTNTVNLLGYGISDDPRYPYKWTFPQQTLEPNQFLILFCSGKDRSELPFFHSNFKLSGSDQIVLTDDQGYTLSSRQIGTTLFDISEGSSVDGGLDVMEYYQATPGFENNNGIAHNELIISHESGFYSDNFELEISSPLNHEVRYTTDGSEPTLLDNIWNGSLSISDQSGRPNSISTIPTTAPNLGEEEIWEAPLETTFKGTCLRIRSFVSAVPSSHILNRSLFVCPESNLRYSLPIISILTDSLNLFDYDTGIYVPGVSHYMDPSGGDVSGTGNYLQIGASWERSANVELINTEGVLEFSQNLGLRIHGSRSRRYPQKSLRLYAREKYGEPSLKHPVFEGLDDDKFKVLVLRNMGQDFTSGVAQDVLAQELAKDLRQATLASRPAVVFINGEYWGIQNLRERFDEHFLAQFHALGTDSIDMIENYFGGVSMGDAAAFDELFSFFESNSLSSQSNFDFVASKMDIEDFIDNTLVRIFLGCYDWPGNNIKIWRAKTPTSKFHWLLLDNDGCMSDAAFNSLEHATAPDNVGWPNPPESTLFLRRLLENDGFKQQFISRMAELLNWTFKRERVQSMLYQLYDTYSPEYNEHNNRWQALYNEQTLENNYDNLISIAGERPCYVRQHFMDYFGLSEAEFPFDCDSASNFSSIGFSTYPISIYPNPSSGTFSLKVPDYVSTIDELNVFDLSGKLMYSKSNIAVGDNTISIAGNNPPSGVYLVNVISQYGSWNERLVIQKE